MAESVYSFRVRDTGMGQHVRDLLGRFAEGNQAIKRANELSVAWLGGQAAESLTTFKRAPDPRNRALRLEELVKRPEASVVTIDGFRFLDDAAITKLRRRVGRYYRALEYGSTYWVGQRIQLRFLGQPNRASRSAAPVQAAWGSRRTDFGAGYWVTITRPVEPRRYARDARDEFIRGRVWWGFAQEELRAKGLGDFVHAKP